MREASKKQKYLVFALLTVLLALIALILVRTLQRTQPDTSVAEPACMYDLTLVIDGTSSISGAGLTANFTQAIDAFLDSVDYNSQRVAILDATGWNNRVNSGYRTNPAELKTFYKAFLNRNLQYCAPGNTCTRNVTTGIGQHLRDNARTVNGEQVQQFVIKIDDGDVAQVPTLWTATNHPESLAYCEINQPKLSAWASLRNRAPDIYWLRFTSRFSISCTTFLVHGNITQGQGRTIRLVGENNTNFVQELTTALNTIASEACIATTPTCGDGNIEPGEICDDGNNDDGDGCSASCQEEVPTPECGNGTIEPPEQCDDGNIIPGDGCSITCEITTQCNDGEDNDGDGPVDCEPGNEDPGCFPDGVGGGGECDEDDDNETDEPILCGNGEIDGDEQCDDGNTVNGDGCSSACEITTECNDGEDNDDDGRVDCQPGNEDPGCFPDGIGGGGVCDPEDDEEEDLQPICGNGIVEQGEQCDDNNTVNGDGCSSTCQITTQCNDGEDNDGDGRVDCEPGNEDPGCFPDGNGGGGVCNPDDDLEEDLIPPPPNPVPVPPPPVPVPAPPPPAEPVCGNGVVETGEQCDDGNTVPGDGCSATCQITTQCNDGVDNDGDGRIDCQAGNQDLGCYPDGNGGGGACDPSNNTEQNTIPTSGGGELPDTGILDEPEYLLVGITLVLIGVLVYRGNMLHLPLLDRAFQSASQSLSVKDFEGRVGDRIKSKRRN